MSKFKHGDRVLTEGEVTGSDGLGNIRVGHLYYAPDQVHPHPGVPVADLLEELELVWRRLSRARASSIGARYDNLEPGKTRSEELRQAREAAQKPKLKEGQELWVRGRLTGHTNCQGRVAVDFGDQKSFYTFDPDDIRTDEP